MLAEFLKEIQLYHVVHLLTLVWFPIARLTSLRFIFFPDATPNLDSDEIQALSLLGVYLFIRARRSGSFDAFVGQVFFASKAALCVILYRHNLAMAIFYLAICTIVSFVLPAPTVDADSRVISVNGPRLSNILQGRGQGGKVQYTMVEFYTTWSSPCNFVAREYAAIAKKYGSPHMKFVKVNASTHPALARKYNVSVGVQSKQLPSFILFADGQEIARRPRVLSGGNIEPCKFSEAFLEEEFSLVVRHTGERADGDRAPRRRGGTDVGDDAKESKKDQ
ncbi:hypothetical protein PTSG_05825 [Salpingoeca rosetta]|uniref:Thioredoxin domain-containing protein n=1 Tax=Salpingoeca rosetta (strain ATCC 50818 / BSB-021) TaxID=946362 RepID=F2UCW6_SALR5|nr:uncharacterized protein PTSG_05825 [Salpingoeca rosetta]EGD74461.1 hypothetical protein PTSG_05825 [Salpingoeca rosetta]|eukprot:XP_004992718.1 hypothetical protein PTSG_05825 [Salpingoeca rosetta]